jgi:tRNA G26 N,N-dimethylase Trm1
MEAIMKQVQLKVFEYSELSEESKEVAYQNWLNHSGDNDFHTDFRWSEIFQSFKILMNDLNLNVDNWSVSYGGYGHDYINWSTCNDNIKEFRGKRAFAYVENNLLSKYRVSYSKYNQNIKQYRSYGYKPNHVECCPLTGVCYDETLIETLLENLKEGYTLNFAVNKVCRKVIKIIHEEYKYFSSKEFFIENCDNNDVYFLENGQIYNL